MDARTVFQVCACPGHAKMAARSRSGSDQLLADEPLTWCDAALALAGGAPAGVGVLPSMGGGDDFFRGGRRPCGLFELRACQRQAGGLVMSVGIGGEMSGQQQGEHQHQQACRTGRAGRHPGVHPILGTLVPSHRISLCVTKHSVFITERHCRWRETRGKTSDAVAAAGQVRRRGAPLAATGSGRLARGRDVHLRLGRGGARGVSAVLCRPAVARRSASALMAAEVVSGAVRMLNDAASPGGDAPGRQASARRPQAGGDPVRPGDGLTDLVGLRAIRRSHHRGHRPDRRSDQFRRGSPPGPPAPSPF